MNKSPGKRGHIFAHDVSWAAQTGKHLLGTQNVSEQNQEQFLCPGHKICVCSKCCTREQTGKRVAATMCPQQLCPWLPGPSNLDVHMYTRSCPIKWHVQSHFSSKISVASNASSFCLSFDIVKIIRVNPNPSPNNFAELRYFLKLECFDSIYIFLENFWLCLPTFSL